MSAPLVGREYELAQVEEMLSLAGERGGALVVRGEAGVGKSALLEAARSSAAGRGLATLTTAGFQSEAHLAFAGLHRLVRPLLRVVDRLQAPQRAALEGAFGLIETGAPDLFVIALATLDLLCEAAAAAPLLLVIDDAQLLDLATCDVLTFVARRIEAEPILMLFALRDGPAAGIGRAGLPELQLGPLNDLSAAAVLDANSPGLAAGVRQRILAEALGNPLALAELPQGTDGFDPASTAPFPLTERLEYAFATRVSGLPAPTRALLLVAALDDGGDQERITDAASLLEGRTVGVADLAAAQAARAITVDGDGLRFRHPLVRSAVLQRALAPERRAAHRALATVYSGDRDRGLWHRAASLTGPDDHVAAELEAAAGRAERCGAADVALAAFERAAGLSTEDNQRARLLLRAAWLAYELGQFDVSTRLARDTQQLEMTQHESTMLRYMLELGQDNMWSGAAAIRSLVEIAGQFQAAGEPDRALNVLQTASSRFWWGNPDQILRDLVVSAAEALSVPDSSPKLLAVLAQADPVKTGCTVIRQISLMSPDHADPAGMYLVGLAASSVWAYDLALVFLKTAVDGLRARARLGQLARALAAQAWAAVHTAREPLAVSAAEEAIALARETGQLRLAVTAQLAKAVVAAERGDFAIAEALAREAEAVLLPMGATRMLALVQFIRGRAAVAHQHYEEGLEHLRRTLDPADPGYHAFIGAWGLSDLVEAAAHTGRRDAAEGYLRQLESLAAQTSGSLLLATAGYARPMLAGDDAAGALYETAVGNDLAQWHCYRGRMLLWYGRWLRRQRRVAESRMRLRAALDSFEALAFPGLAESARQELRASGVTPSRRAPEAWAQLTPQELQIAQMAATGDTNRTIGEQLYLSPRTVQSHMYRIFPKLGITARSQLRDAFPELTFA